mgnify:CR=1 FL=1
MTGAEPPLPGESAHFRALESLYLAAPITRLFPSTLTIPSSGESVIQAVIGPEACHAAGAIHGTGYFKMLDDAAFYAANSLVNDRFLLTTAFNLLFTRPLKPGPVTAYGRWISGRRRGPERSRTWRIIGFRQRHRAGGRADGPRGCSGWGFGWEAWTPVTVPEWRGWVTIESLTTLRDNGRL